jgi:methionyl-tRNA synthetase
MYKSLLKAEQLGISPEALTNQIKLEHEADFRTFGIEYDMYHTTHSEENKALAELIYQRLSDAGHIIKKTILQAFDPVKSMFLPDRFIKGTCPKCKASDQYGDNCEACGATYAPTDLIDPVSALTGATPIHKESEHYFFDLPHFKDLLETWTKEGHLQTEVANKLDEWFKAGLVPWDISRDAPYFGFQIPGTVDKYFYVWLDAPIGYMASCKKYCELHHKSFETYWGPDSTTELYHFVGKDIVYFHALFWPAMLFGSQHRLPTSIFTHGFLTVNGQKMSKSRGTFIEAKAFANHLDPEYLRYYFAAKLNGRVEDIDLNFEDFKNRINADLVGKVVNIASRCAGFIHKQFDGKLADSLARPDLYTQILNMKAPITEAYIARDYAHAIRQIMEAAACINQYIDQEKPWVLAKEEAHRNQVQLVCTMGLNLFRLLITYLKPVLPHMAKQAETFLNCTPLDFQHIDTPLLDHEIQPFTPLMTRVTEEKIEALLQHQVAKL